ncbi:MAG: GIY-YIG nuclease family protein [Candidatus Roizmanbacteria bacterium]|nr:MAG: GIY-YIG nuclease family protein [Candidatus Roizmanbacteria bacterium]
MNETNNAVCYKLSKSELTKLPATTGVYIFRNRKEILYIGKSINLKARALSHWENSKIDNKEAAIIQNSKWLETQITDSEFMALILESRLIQKYKPKYNARWRDDKSYLYIKINTKTDYPKILSSRKEFDGKSKYFGPFSSVKNVFKILKEVRRVFPFCSQKNITKKQCFYSKIHLCSPCPNEIEQVIDLVLKRNLKLVYRRNIYSIIKVLEGKTEPILNQLYKNLKKLSEEEKYEEALITRDRIMHLETLLHKRLFSADTALSYNLSTQSTESLIKLLSRFFSNLQDLKRIECIDISNFALKQATASLVVFTEGLMDKNEYRRFKIKDLTLKSDFEMMKEVLERRFRQNWPFPDLLVTDGGKPQVKTALKVTADLNIKVPIIGIAKHPDRLVIGNNSLETVKPDIHHLGFNLVRAIRDESHRFARKYHIFLRDKKIV